MIRLVRSTLHLVVLELQRVASLARLNAVATPAEAAANLSDMLEQGSQEQTTGSPFNQDAQPISPQNIPFDHHGQQPRNCRCYPSDSGNQKGFRGLQPETCRTEPNEQATICGSNLRPPRTIGSPNTDLLCNEGRNTDRGDSQAKSHCRSNVWKIVNHFVSVPSPILGGALAWRQPACGNAAPWPRGETWTTNTSGPGCHAVVRPVGRRVGPHSRCQTST